MLSVIIMTCISCKSRNWYKSRIVWQLESRNSATARVSGSFCSKYLFHKKRGISYSTLKVIKATFWCLWSTHNFEENACNSTTMYTTTLHRNILHIYHLDPNKPSAFFLNYRIYTGTERNVRINRCVCLWNVLRIVGDKKMFW